MKKFAFVFAAPLFACASLFADAYADMQSYKAATASRGSTKSARNP